MWTLCKYCKRGCVFTRHHCQVDLRKEEDIMIQDFSLQTVSERTRGREDGPVRRETKVDKEENLSPSWVKSGGFLLFWTRFNPFFSAANWAERAQWTDSHQVGLFGPARCCLRVGLPIYRFSINGTMCTVVPAQGGQHEVGQTNSALSLFCSMYFHEIQAEH